MKHFKHFLLLFALCSISSFAQQQEFIEIPCLEEATDNADYVRAFGVGKGENAQEAKENAHAYLVREIVQKLANGGFSIGKDIDVLFHSSNIESDIRNNITVICEQTIPSQQTSKEGVSETYVAGQISRRIWNILKTQEQQRWIVNQIDTIVFHIYTSTQYRVFENERLLNILLQKRKMANQVLPKTIEIYDKDWLYTLKVPYQALPQNAIEPFVVRSENATMTDYIEQQLKNVLETTNDEIEYIICQELLRQIETETFSRKFRDYLNRKSEEQLDTTNSL